MITDPKEGANLLQRMTDEPGEMQFNDHQARAIVEVMIPRMITSAPGMAGRGLKCKVEETSTGWIIRVDRP